MHLVIALLFGISFSQTNTSVLKNHIIQAVIEDFHLIIVGAENTPRYTFWLGSNDSIVYSVYFKQIFEVIGYFNTKVAASVITPRKWTFSEVERREDGYYFTLSHFSENNTNLAERARYASLIIDHRIAFRDHLNSSCPDEICIQYTLHFNGYQWYSREDRVSLCFSFWVTSSAHNEPKSETFHDRVVYGNALFLIDQEAHADYPERVATDIVDPESLSEHWVKYYRFKGDMRHSGVIGFAGASYLESGGYFLMSSNDIILYAGIAALCVFFVVVGMWAYNRYQRRKSEYIEID